MTRRERKVFRASSRQLLLFFVWLSRLPFPLFQHARLEDATREMSATPSCGERSRGSPLSTQTRQCKCSFARFRQSESLALALQLPPPPVRRPPRSPITTLLPLPDNAPGASRWAWGRIPSPRPGLRSRARRFLAGVRLPTFCRVLVQRERERAKALSRESESAGEGARARERERERQRERESRT